MTPPSSPFDQMRLREAARSAKIREAWLAAGHTIEPGGGPTISAGKLFTSRMNAAKQPAAPEYSVTFKTGPTGLSYVSAYFYSPGGKQHIYVDYSLPTHSPPLTSGKIKIRQPGNSYSDGMFSPYAVPGTWTLEYLYIYDKADHETEYDQQQVAALFPKATLALANGAKPDGAAPIVSAGKILTPVVKLGSANPVFRTQLTVSDNLSGVRSVSVWVYPPGSSNSLSGYNDPPAPLKSGKLGVSTYLGTSPKTGTWTISEIETCDVATNCVYDSDVTDLKALFGTTTFQVRN